MFACGSIHTLFLDSDGKVWACGSNTNGQLGVSELRSYTHFVCLEELPFIIQISVSRAAGTFSFFLDNDGSVWCCGEGTLGQLGIEKALHELVILPHKVPNLPLIDAVSCGMEHTILLDNAGRIWGSGDNQYGQLGLEGSNRTEFTLISSILTAKVTKVSCGSNTTIIQNESGQLWGCGYNAYGQIGLGHNINRIHSFARIPLDTTANYIVDFFCSSSFSFILDSNHEVWSAGWNIWGQLGQGDPHSRNRFTKIMNIPKIRQLLPGKTHALIIDIDGKVWGCGNNSYGQLGTSEHVTNTQSPILIPDLSNIINGGCGAHHSFLIDDQGQVWGSGYNGEGQLALDSSLRLKKFHIIPFVPNSIGGPKRFRNTKRAIL